MPQQTYPKRLIEVDLPIARISAHARREKSIRHGHISTLHIWWARRPLASCRAVTCAALWPDPVDLQSGVWSPESGVKPERFLDEARDRMRRWADIGYEKASDESAKRLMAIRKKPARLDDPEELRVALLDFIADFSNWDNSTDADYLETARALTQAAHEALGGDSGTLPFVVDPFAGGGAIPLEALRVGAEAFASDLNPVAVLLNKVVLEYIPRFGSRLAERVREWGAVIRQEAEESLAELYPSASLPLSIYVPQPEGSRSRDGGTWRLVGTAVETPVAYLWARTIRCEGPGCGAEVPLLRSLWLAKKGTRSLAVRLKNNLAERRVDFEILENPKPRDVGEGTVRRGSGNCPLCGFTTPVDAVRRQLKERAGGAADARLIAVVVALRCDRAGANTTEEFAEPGRFYRLPTEADRKGLREAAKLAEALEPGLVPDELISLNELRRISVPLYGMTAWGHLFTPREALTLATLSRLVANLPVWAEDSERELAGAVQACLALTVDRQANTLTSLSRWHTTRENVEGVFARQAIPMVWDFAEANPLSDSTGCFDGALEWVLGVCEAESHLARAGGSQGHAEMASATALPLPDDSAQALLTDPPYYDAVPYAHLSDFFFVWLRRSLKGTHSRLFSETSVPKDPEIVVDRPHALSSSKKDVAQYERMLGEAFAEARRVLRPDGIGTVVFASKTTASWEAILQALVDAGWVLTASWPIDTEMGARVAAQGQARLGSSVHLVCRPRENPDGSARTSVGEWRDVIGELPGRIHEWLPRLAKEGVVGADAIFACIGPALEIFSRYSRVEKVSGETVPLGEYLEQVWAAVAKEAMSVVFEGADATGFEPDARLTAMWLWTLSGAKGAVESGATPTDEDDEEAEAAGRKPKLSGYVLEFDAARKIAQGLGAHLEKMGSVVEVKGETARLLPVGDRAAFLFESAAKQAEEARRAKPKGPKQLSLFTKEEAVEAEARAVVDLSGLKGAATVLDRLHQAMLLFGAGRGEAMKRFLVEEGAGADPRLWKLAQALSALYPSGSEEKRWVDGVLGRKKGLGY